MIYVGDPYPLSVTVRDANDALANAGNMALTITGPTTGTVVDPIAPTTTGVYDYNFTPTEPGRFEYRWVATGANARTLEDVFNVEEALTGALISLADAKAHLGSTRTTNDEELRSFILTASEWVERQAGPFARQTRTEVVTSCDGFLYLDGPVVALTSIAAAYGSSGATYSAATVTAQSPELASGKVWLGTVWSYGPLLVTYTAGMSAVPALVRSAVKDYLKWDWASQRGSSPTSLDLADEMATVPGTVPFKIAQKLDTYRRPVVA